MIATILGVLLLIIYNLTGNPLGIKGMLCAVGMIVLDWFFDNFIFSEDSNLHVDPSTALKALLIIIALSLGIFEWFMLENGWIGG